jgi:hypothetical protein
MCASGRLKKILMPSPLAIGTGQHPTPVAVTTMRWRAKARLARFCSAFKLPLGRF